MEHRREAAGKTDRAGELRTGGGLHDVRDVASKSADNAARLDNWLLDYCKRERTRFVPTKVVQQFGPGGLRGRAAIEAVVMDLEELGRARLCDKAGAGSSK